MANKSNATTADEEAEREAAVQRGVPEGQLDEVAENTTWVVSNRVDDVVVLWEQDPRHPGGEAFIGGEAPDHVYKTAAVNRVLYDQLAKEVPAPAREIKHPITGEMYPNPLHSQENAQRTTDQRAVPGQPIMLGRELAPRFYSQEQVEADSRKALSGRREIPSEATMPSDNAGERRT